MGALVSFTVDTSKLKIVSLMAAQREKAIIGMYQLGESIMTKAKLLCPVDTGNLRSTGHVEPPKHEGGRVIVRLAFGGSATDYAIYVHENLLARHPVGQAKYLEQPFLEEAPKLGAVIAGAIR